MFGKHWEPATGIIVDTRIVGGGHSGQNGMPATVHEYVVDVTPASGEQFRTLVEQPTISTDWWGPKIGTQVRFRHDAKSGKVKFDKSDPVISFKAQMKARSSSFDATLAQGSSSRPAAGATSPGAGYAAVPGMPSPAGGFLAAGMTPEQLNQIIASAMANAQVVRLGPQQDQPG